MLITTSSLSRVDKRRENNDWDRPAEASFHKSDPTDPPCDNWPKPRVRLCIRLTSHHLYRFASQSDIDVGIRPNVAQPVWGSAERDVACSDDKAIARTSVGQWNGVRLTRSMSNAPEQKDAIP
jgi:hypothetical protein